MNFEVLLQMTTLSKGLLTLITRKGFLSSMNSQMANKDGWLTEWLGTMRTTIRFLASMNSCVSTQLAWCNEWFRTLRTMGFLFFSVNPGVYSKVFCTGKALGAMNTKMAFFTWVTCDMSDSLFWLCKGLFIIGNCCTKVSCLCSLFLPINISLNYCWLT